jgi:trimethylamine---corrinoid protein Co-methyltransferase
MKVNSKVNQTVHFNILSKSQIEEIASTAYDILERVGVQINDESILGLLKNAGCIIKEKTAFIPSFLVNECLALSPKKITISNRNGKIAMLLEKDRIYFGAGSECPFILDSFTQERRHWLTKDIEDAARIADSLDNIDFHMSLGILSDAPNNMKYDRYQFAAMLKNTIKPIVSTAVDSDGLRDMYNMCCIVKEGEDNFRQKPFFVLYIETISPLIHSKLVLGKIKFAAEKGIPVIYTNAVNAGATGPVTLAGTIAQGAAEYLSGVVISQLIKKGTPVIGGGTLFSMDMNTGVASYGSTENYLMDAAMTEVCKYFGLPVFSLAGCSSSKIFDSQATLESMFGTMSAALSGANIIHDVGYLEDGLCGSYEQLVITDEIVAMVKKYIQGIKVDTNTLALDVIEKVGPGGNFLSEEHTYKNFKSEMLMPKLIDRNVYANWKAAGAKSLETRVNEKVKDILSNYKPEPLPDAKLAAIDEYIKGI